MNTYNYSTETAWRLQILLSKKNKQESTKLQFLYRNKFVPVFKMVSDRKLFLSFFFATDLSVVLLFAFARIVVDCLAWVQFSSTAFPQRIGWHSPALASTQNPTNQLTV